MKGLHRSRDDGCVKNVRWDAAVGEFPSESTKHVPWWNWECCGHKRKKRTFNGVRMGGKGRRYRTVATPGDSVSLA